MFSDTWIWAGRFRTSLKNIGVAPEIAGRTAQAPAQLREAVRKEDALTYNEPADWCPPTRLLLGQVLLDVHRSKDAQAVFDEELRRHPNEAQAKLGLVWAGGGSAN